MRLEEIRNKIVKGLHEHTGVTIVPTDTADRKPDYPYISYKITSSHDANTFSLVDKLIKAADPKFAHDIQVNRLEQPIITISINAYGENDGIAYDLAVKARDWFTFHGELYFIDLNVVVVNATNISDRTQQIVDDYERRHGFDVRIRSARAIAKRVETIEVYTLDGKIIGKKNKS